MDGGVVFVPRIEKGTNTEIDDGMCKPMGIVSPEQKEEQIGEP
jgi:hypothetical protein